MGVVKQVTYKDFSGGDWGNLGEFRAAPNMFKGKNVVTYDNGLLGPRGGLHENTYSGTMQGNIYGIWLLGKIGKPLIIFAGDDIYSTTEDNENLGTVTLEATLDAEPTEFVKTTWYDPNGDIYFTSPGDKTYYINWTTNALNNLPVRNSGVDDAGVETVVLCRDRLYAIGDGRTGGNGGQYVYVSAAADFTNFSGGETFQVGYFNSIRAAIESQNSLLFSCLESTNNIGSGVGWYALTPATPQGDLRRVNTQVATERQHEVVNAEGNNFYFWSGWTTANEDNPYLVQANGAKFDDQSFFHIRFGAQYRSGYYNAPDQVLIYVGNTDNNAWIRMNNAWTYHEFEVPVSGPVCPTERGDSFLLPYGAPGTDVKVYELVSSPDGPTASNVNAMPGDASTVPFDAYFYMPAYQSDTKEVRVRRVIVDFKKWNIGHTGGNNTFNVVVNTYGQYNLPGGTTDGTNTTTIAWSEAQSAAATDGTLDRFVARVGNQGWAPAFQIGITDIQAVAIESITVEFEEADGAGQETYGGRTK